MHQFKFYIVLIVLSLVLGLFSCSEKEEKEKKKEPLMVPFIIDTSYRKIKPIDIPLQEPVEVEIVE